MILDAANLVREAEEIRERTKPEFMRLSIKDKALALANTTNNIK